MIRRITEKSVAPAIAVLALIVGLGVGCSSDDSATSTTTAAPSTTTAPPVRPYAVGRSNETLVDPSRPTPAGSDRPAKDDRTIETSIYYPAEGNPGNAAVDGAPSDHRGAPFPLVVLGHGLGGNEESLAPLAEEWVAAGYVVAMPHFPLTYAGTPGGIDGADVQNQPGDVSFVIDQVLAEAGSENTVLAGLVDEEKVGVAGHSNGAITALGLVANSCCRDERVGTALVLSGTPSPFVGGSYDFTDIPPIMFVHGVNDQAISYNQAVETFDEAATPKALLTLEQSDHGSWLAPDGEAFAVTAQASIDFLDAYLRGDESAISRIADDEVPKVATMAFAPDDDAKVTVETTPTPETDRKASVSDDSNLTDGQSVTVSWSGFLPGKTVNVLQCTGDGRGGTASCGLGEGHVLVPDPTGKGSIDLVVHTGPFANATCDASNPCTILVNDSGMLDPDAFVYFPITLAG